MSDAILPNSNALYCDICNQHSGNISMLQHFVTMPTFLTIELSSSCISQVLFPQNMEVSVSYSLEAIVRCKNHHFTVAIKQNNHWLYVDHLCISVKEYSSLFELFLNHHDGWFFAVYRKCSTLLNDNDGSGNSTVFEPQHLHLEDNSHRISDSSKQTSISKFEIHDTINKRSRREYMKMYKKESKDHATKMKQEERKNLYMRQYRDKKINNETKDMKKLRNDKQSSKQEKTSSVVKNAFIHVVQKIDDTNAELSEKSIVNQNQTYYNIAF